MESKRKTPAVGVEVKKELVSKRKKDRSASVRRLGTKTRPAVGGSPGSVHKKVLQPLAKLPTQAAKKLLQPLAELPAQAAKKVLQRLAKLPAQAAKKVLQPLAELLPAQAAAELVQPGAPSQAANSIQPLAELQHVLMRRRWTRIRTRLPVQKTSVQPLAKL